MTATPTISEAAHRTLRQLPAAVRSTLLHNAIKTQSHRADKLISDREKDRFFEVMSRHIDGILVTAGVSPVAPYVAAWKVVAR